MAVIKNVTKRGEDTLVKISFDGDENGGGDADIKFPDPNLKKCGEALSKRNDCVPIKPKPRKRRDGK